MSAHRHWRIYITANDGDAAYTGLSEIEWLDAGDVDLTTGKTASASSQAGGAASNAIDDDQNTKWVTNAWQSIPSWHAVDFGVPVAPVSVSLRPQKLAPSRAPTAFDIQYSDDGAAWVTHSSVSGSTGWAELERRVYVIAAPTYITGTLTDDTGAPCARTVRAYQRDTGELAGSTTSDPVTGAYTLALTAVPHYIVALDDEAGTQYNALIADRITPA